MTKVRVLVADKHGLVREGICALLRACEEIEVVGEANNGQEALAMIGTETPDVALIDIGLPVIDGASLTRRIHNENGTTKVVFLGDTADRGTIIRGIKAGGEGYILKGATGQDLLSAIMTVHKGGYFLYPPVAKQMVEEFLSAGKAPETDDYDRLSDQEKEVLKLVADGRSRHQIAEILNEPPEKIQRHRANLMKKLGIHSQAALVNYALRKRIISLEI